jgi:hypothetical protein
LPEQELADPAANLVADAPEHPKPFLLRSFHSRVVEWPMQPFGGARKYRASFPRRVTNRNQQVRWPLKEFVYGLGMLVRDVDADFGHDDDGFRTHLGQPRSSREHFETGPGS